MNSNYYNNYVPNNYGGNFSQSDDRLIGGGFAFPFLLGGVTGAALAPNFWRPPYNRPYPVPYYQPYPPYPPYPPFRPYR